MHQAVAADAAVCRFIRLFDKIGAFEGGRGVNRHHHRHAVDGQRLVIGGAGAAAAAFVAGLGINESGAERLQLVDQRFRRQAGVCCSIGVAPCRCGVEVGMGCDHRVCRAIVDDEMQQFGPRIVADGIHHPLALEDQAHVEIGNQDAFALGRWRLRDACPRAR